MLLTIILATAALAAFVAHWYKHHRARHLVYVSCTCGKRITCPAFYVYRGDKALIQYDSARCGKWEQQEQRLLNERPTQDNLTKRR